MNVDICETSNIWDFQKILLLEMISHIKAFLIPVEDV